MSTSLATGKISSGSRPESVLILAFGLMFVGGLFSVPRSSLVSSLPWKMELLSSIFLLGWTIFVLIRRNSALRGVLSLPRSTVLLIALLAAFVVWSALSAIWAAYPLLSVQHTLTWTIYLSFMVVISLQLYGSGDGLRIVTGAFALAAVVAGIVCIIDYLTVIDFTSSEGPLRTRYAQLGEMMVTVGPILAVSSCYARNKGMRWVGFAAAALGWIVVMMSLSKGAFLSGILGFIVLFVGATIFSDRRFRKNMLVLAAFWLLITLGFQLYFSAALSMPSTTDYITGNADKTRSTSTMRLFTWSVARQMIADHWLIGVGAGNFGTAFNEARADLKKDPAVSGGEIAEDYMVERAHNEFAQMWSELGIIGIAVIVGVFGYFGFLLVRFFPRNQWRISPMLWASIGGMSAFFASSLVSSFALRSIQNGIAFFLVFSIAIYEVVKMGRRGAERRSRSIDVKPRQALAICMIAAVMMLAYSGSKAVGEYYLYAAQRTAVFEQSERYARTSLKFDPSNASAYLWLAAGHASEHDHAGAAALLSEGIQRGIGVSITYSDLAKYQALAGDPAAAERTLNEAIRIFPQSVFLRVRFATFLEDAGRPVEAAAQMEFARTIDAKHANGWYQIIRNGSVAAFYAAKNDPSLAAPAELSPYNAVLEYLDERRLPSPE